ncbi:aminotransferase [Clostridium omnivorum]|uniref:Aminotransferase n=1 Tax=Clostridium omnivorum TaxID=1604902 RepID=A0ABQ5N0L1_9CLOT|nr:aminotransferase [Clostridium sp. E14]
MPEAISLTLGQPDFKVPDRIKKAMIDAINEDKTEYTSNIGLFQLREHIAQYLLSFKIKYSPEEICLTIGGSEALLAVFTALVNAGDKVLIPNVAYPAYDSCIKLLGGNVVNYPLNQDFTMDISSLENIIDNEKPKIMVLSYPSNPTGATLSKDDRDKLHSIILNKNIMVVTDEIYSSLCFEEEYYSISQFSDIRDKVIFVGGFSKMFSMTGLRLGYLCANKEIMKSVLKVHQYAVSCAPSISQYGALEGLKNCLDEVEKMRCEFQKRRDYVYNRLKLIGFDVVMPKGAFYIFPSVKKFGFSSEEFCERLLNDAKVAIVPGSAFGPGGEGFARISYSYSMEQLKDALDRIEKFINDKL